MPQRFTKLAADLWRPVVLSRADPALKGRFFMFQGKLKPGVTLEQAAADVDVIARRLAQQHPTHLPEAVHRQRRQLGRQHRRPVQDDALHAGGGGGAAAAISCFNVANMLLALATGREKEMAIRGALGAGRSHLVRQLLVESLLLAAAGAAARLSVRLRGHQGHRGADSRRLHPARSRHPAERAGAALQPGGRRADGAHLRPRARRCRRRGATSSSR